MNNNTLRMPIFRTFGGYSDPEKVAAEHSNLLKSLNDEDKKKVQSDGPFYEAGYDAPYKRFDRRNEIWVPCVETPSPAKTNPTLNRCTE